MAHKAVHECSCNQDPDKDGCYRCLYQYRLGRLMSLVSRERAKEVLDELVGSLDQLQQVPTISDIYIDPMVESELERNFLRGLRKLSKLNGLPLIRLVQEVFRGKSAWLLEVGQQKYWLEPQVDLGPADGVAVKCRPDFLIWPARSTSSRRPIAVFCDGWAYHRDRLRDDAVKRNAIVLSGRFWVWSVVNDDVRAALDDKLVTDLESPFTTMQRHSPNPPTGSPLEPRHSAFSENALTQLVRLLALPDSATGDPFHVELRKNAAWVTFSMLANPGHTADMAELQASFAAVWQNLPSWMSDKPAQSALAGNAAGTPTLRYHWPHQFLKGNYDAGLTPGVILHDDTPAGLSEKDQQTHWRRWLWLFNTCQTLTGVLLVTSAGLEHRDYDPLLPKTASPATAGPDAASSAWEAALQSALESVRPGLLILRDAGAPPPDQLGYELPGDRDEVIAEAEIVWLAPRLVVLTEAQADYAPVWTSLGWHPILAGAEWASTVLQFLQTPDHSSDQKADS